MHSARIVQVGLLALALPFGIGACDLLKRGGADAAADAPVVASPAASASAAAPAASAVETAAPAPTDTAPLAPGAVVTPGVLPKGDAGLRLDAGARDAGPVDAGGRSDASVAPIPTPLPVPKLPPGAPSLPPGFPTVMPTAIPSLPWPPPAKK